MKRYIKHKLETFTAAEDYYKQHGASVQEVADMFGIKKSTLHDWLKRKHDPENPFGKKTALTKQEIFFGCLGFCGFLRLDLHRLVLLLVRL